jgi:hypothetical protein
LAADITGEGANCIAPTGLRHSAQRCHDEGVATLGSDLQNEINPEGVASMRAKR